MEQNSDSRHQQFLPGHAPQGYQLQEKAMSNSFVYVEVQTGMHGLLQVDILTQELISKCLKKHIYYQWKLVHGLWKHIWRPIQYALVVEDFGMKKVEKEHEDHLLSTFKANYKIVVN